MSATASYTINNIELFRIANHLIYQGISNSTYLASVYRLY